ncbi:MAG TPA: carbohydrate kinase [Firmicutes bacterium]|nr:carbohydrate kinase [Bacillota bacterium]
MNRVLVFGEVLIDLFATETEMPRLGVPRFHLEGVPGGAPCNVAANLARLGLPVSLITGLADDPPGLQLRAMLVERGIDLSYSVSLPDSSTALATVVSRPDGERSFRLYLRGSILDCLSPDVIDLRCMEGAGWFHFGSVLLAYSKPKEATLTLLQEAWRRGLIISCDINIRPDIWKAGDVSPSVLLEVLRYVHLVKCSDEDLSWLGDNVDSRLASPRAFLRDECRVVAYTRGKEGATLLAEESKVEVSAPPVRVVDTTGAGDAFMAGLIAYFHQQGVGSAAELERVASDRDRLASAGEMARECAGCILRQLGGLPPAG